jgi:flavodoxin I
MEMITIGLFFGSTTGNTEDAARQIQAALGEDLVSVQDVGQAKADTMKAYDVLIFGTSTWGCGEPQDDWARFEPELEKIDWSQKRVALFGLGDQYGYGDTFVDAMGMLYEALVAQGAEVIGQWDGPGYEFTASRAFRDGQFVGLALDADNQPDMTAERVEQWVQGLRGELGL